MSKAHQSERSYRKIIGAWCWYDWANSAFVTTVTAAILPPFFRTLATNSGLAENTATAYWAYTSAAALLLIALASPVLGAVSDITGGKKRYLGFFAGLGILSTGALFFLGRESWQTASILYIAGEIGFVGSIVFYESLLPHISRKGDMDRISSRAWAFGYMGGGLLLIINMLWILRPAWFGFSSPEAAIKVSFLSVAVWWGVFSVPLLATVPEPPGAPQIRSKRPIRTGFAQVKRTLSEISRYKQLFLFLVAFWLYNDGIGTIIKMASAYGHEIGISLNDLILALVITQIVGIPCTFLFGALARKIRAKRAVIASLAVYTLICVLGYFMSKAWHFYALAILVGTVQGGAQSLSRSIFAVMVPRHRSAEFFGFYSTSSKFAGIFGPFIFGILSQVSSSRFGIFALIVFFVAGGALLSRVDVEKGAAAARAAEADHAKDGTDGQS
jgi:UMF1 family MFS transporter